MLEIKSIDKPDERRDFPKGHVEMLDLPEFPIGRATFEPGWRWSESVKPIAGTDSCQFHHKCYVLSGRMHVRMEDDRIEMRLAAADAPRLLVVSQMFRPDWVARSAAQRLPACFDTRP